jgi:MFS family permease
LFFLNRLTVIAGVKRYAMTEYMWTFFALGSLLGAFFWIRFKKDLPYSYALGGVIVLWAIVPFMLTLVDTSILVYGLMFFGGISYAPYNIVAPTLRQRLVPNDIRGRVFGVYGLIGGLGLPLGVYLGGILGELYGPISTLLLASMFTFCLGIFVFVHPALRFKDAKELIIRKG